MLETRKIYTKEQMREHKRLIDDIINSRNKMLEAFELGYITTEEKEEAMQVYSIFLGD